MSLPHEEIVSVRPPHQAIYPFLRSTDQNLTTSPIEIPEIIPTKITMSLRIKLRRKRKKMEEYDETCKCHIPIILAKEHARYAPIRSIDLPAFLQQGFPLGHHLVFTHFYSTLFIQYPFLPAQTLFHHYLIPKPMRDTWIPQVRFCARLGSYSCFLALELRGMDTDSFFDVRVCEYDFLV
jgi:hypothetical protein